MSHRFATVNEAAEYLHVTPVTIQRMFSDQRLTRFKLGGVVRVDLNEVDQRMAGDAHD